MESFCRVGKGRTQGRQRMGPADRTGGCPGLPRPVTVGHGLLQGCQLAPKPEHPGDVWPALPCQGRKASSAP